MSLKMRDLPRLTASILFNINKHYKVVEEAVKVVAQWRDDSTFADLIAPLDALGEAVDALADPRNNHTICKVLLPKMNAKLRKLQTEGMFIVGVCYEEANVQPVETVEAEEVIGEEVFDEVDPFSRYDPPQEKE